MNPEWKKYTGSDKQIAELSGANHGVCLKFEHSQKSFVYSLKDISTTNGVPSLSNTVTYYLICDPHPLADMICQQACTGQPVWVRTNNLSNNGWYYHDSYTNVNWNIPNAEYSFTPFEEEA